MAIYTNIETGQRIQSTKNPDGTTTKTVLSGTSSPSTTNATLSTPIASPVPADQIQPPTQVTTPEPTSLEMQTANMASVQGTVDKARTNYTTVLDSQKTAIDTEIANLKKEQQTILDAGKELTKPFREKLNQKESERLKVQENFDAMQKLTNELDGLLTQGNELIRIATGRQVSGKVLEKSLSKTMVDVQARAGVIEAVLSARSNQIAEAHNIIDRQIAAITSDRQDELSYYNTLLELNNNSLIKLDAESSQIAIEQRDNAKRAVDEAEKTANYIKDLMINPETAQFMADAGVTLSDTVEGIQTKMAKQAKVQEAIDVRNNLVSAGYDISPVPVAGGVEVEAGGTKIYARVRPGSELDLKLKAAEANIAQSYAAAAASRASAAKNQFDMLMERYKAGDTSVVDDLGFDPASLNGGLEGAQQYQMQRTDLQMGIDAAQQILENKSGIKLLTGALQSPLIAGIGQALGLGVAGGAAGGAVIGGVGAVPGAIAGGVAGAAASPFYVSRLKLDKDSAIGALNFLVNDTTFQEIIDLRAQGVTFGNMTEGERIAAGRAAERLNAAVKVDESGNIVSISATPDEAQQYVTDLLKAYEGRQEYLDTVYSVKPDEMKEAQTVWGSSQ